MMGMVRGLQRIKFVPERALVRLTSTDSKRLPLNENNENGMAGKPYDEDVYTLHVLRG